MGAAAQLAAVVLPGGELGLSLLSQIANRYLFVNITFNVTGKEKHSNKDEIP